MSWAFEVYYNLTSHNKKLRETYLGIKNSWVYLDLWVEILYQIKIKHKNVRELSTMGPNVRDNDVIYKFSKKNEIHYHVRWRSIIEWFKKKIEKEKKKSKDSVLFWICILTIVTCDCNSNELWWYWAYRVGSVSKQKLLLVSFNSLQLNQLHLSF